MIEGGRDAFGPYNFGPLQSLSPWVIAGMAGVLDPLINRISSRGFGEVKELRIDSGKAWYNLGWCQTFTQEESARQAVMEPDKKFIDEMLSAFI